MEIDAVFVILTIFLKAIPTNGQYQITIYTGYDEGAGTDAKVHLKLYGHLGTSPAITLSSDNSHFEMGRVDTYHVAGTDFGIIHRLEIGHDDTGDSPEWELRGAYLVDLKRDSGSYFVCDCWLGTGSLLSRKIDIPVDGNYDDWSVWSECSSTCIGTRKRTRTCSNPPPANNGAECRGPISDYMECNKNATCPVDGVWSDWEPYSDCSVTCGQGTQSRRRSCTSPFPRNGGATCPDQDADTRVCDKVPCPVDGDWGNWFQFGACSTTCGGGIAIRRRLCSSPVFGGQTCPGKPSEETACNEEPCPVDGAWSEWGSFILCSATCGSGTKSRERACDNPVPAHGGQACSGDEIDVHECTENYCPVAGGWGDWSQFSSCPVLCGGSDVSRQVRTRHCDQPVPAYGGASCDGPDEEVELCGQYPCSVDGGWSEWNSIKQCSSLCGGGLLERSRECINPPPQNGGQPCEGLDKDSIVCNTHPCEESWSEWSECDCSKEQRHRTCTNDVCLVGAVQYDQHQCPVQCSTVKDFTTTAMTDDTAPDDVNYSACNKEEFLCDDGACIHMKRKCDGINDCHNDEIDCVHITNSGRNDLMWLWVLIACIVVLVVASILAIVYVVCARKKQSRQRGCYIVSGPYKQSIHTDSIRRRQDKNGLPTMSAQRTSKRIYKQSTEIEPFTHPESTSTANRETQKRRATDKRASFRRSVRGKHAAIDRVSSDHIEELAEVVDRRNAGTLTLYFKDSPTNDFRYTNDEDVEPTFCRKSAGVITHI